MIDRSQQAELDVNEMTSMTMTSMALTFTSRQTQYPESLT
jgi:hypothetical protein